ncbi:hypothetical protein HPB48_002749 [Haemaphysalis longicornis]|uniref:Uncharacterized protein n=1 Tax=Haemaphysalis longicornis TaxID=44386 RepID=A0A9J6GQH5_HAELO|nr:hypothetical protein HPB48_002749 [Haemaphysalis longicornis]
MTPASDLKIVPQPAQCHFHYQRSSFRMCSTQENPPENPHKRLQGTDPGAPSGQLLATITSTRPPIIEARMLGTYDTAALAFDGLTVRFYVKAHGTLVRCRPYRNTYQCSAKRCGLGHRPDVCPNPQTNLCSLCHAPNPAPDHSCHTQCQLCGLPHLTANRECRLKLKPPPPHPYPPQRQAQETRQPALSPLRRSSGPTSKPSLPEHRRGISLCNISIIPTHLGSSVSRDTTQDITFVRNVSQYTWQCIRRTLGSDHRSYHHLSHYQDPLGVACLTDWKAFRDTLEATTPTNSNLD